MWQIIVNLRTVKQKDSVFTDKFVLKMSIQIAFIRLLSISLNLYLTVHRPFSYHLSPSGWCILEDWLVVASTLLDWSKGHESPQKLIHWPQGLPGWVPTVK